MEAQAERVQRYAVTFKVETVDVLAAAVVLAVELALWLWMNACNSSALTLLLAPPPSDPRYVCVLSELRALCASCVNCENAACAPARLSACKAVPIAWKSCAMELKALDWFAPPLDEAALALPDDALPLVEALLPVELVPLLDEVLDEEVPSSDCSSCETALPELDPCE